MKDGMKELTVLDKVTQEKIIDTGFPDKTEIWEKFFMFYFCAWLQCIHGMFQLLSTLHSIIFYFQSITLLDKSKPFKREFSIRANGGHTYVLCSLNLEKRQNYFRSSRRGAVVNESD